MRDLWLYDLLSRRTRLSYRLKIMLMAFVGTHIPLIALIGFVAFFAAATWQAFTVTLLVALTATLVGTAITLFVLDHLLRPVIRTSRTLRRYKETRDTGSLPSGYTDEVGTLMADAISTLVHLDCTIDALEHVDAATGLPNRRRLTSDLGARVAVAAPFALVAVRFGNYAQIAETLDLLSAERAARTFAERLGGAAPRAKLYRVAAADFVLLVEDVTETAADKALAQDIARWLTAASASLTAGSVTVTPAALAGVALYPGDGAAPDVLIDQALGAVAQASGVRPVGFHSPEVRRAALRRLELEEELRRAINRDEFVLHYQPVVDLSAGRSIGAEALIRWQHPEHGLLPPVRFIPAAEENGTIDAIGMWVLRQSCRQVREWNDGGVGAVKVAVNLSARQFLDPGLVGYVGDTLNDAGISPDQLEIELTETAAMADEAHTRAVFGRLRDLGVSIAIDDFGSGYAGMSYLRKLPFDKLKIDREFVTDVHRTPDNQAICDALVALARGLKLRLLAEGVEQEEEVAFLRDRGCDLFQGYWFSRPVAAKTFSDSLTQEGMELKVRRLRQGAALADGSSTQLVRKAG